MADDHANGLLGDYRLIRILGSGRTSTVYLAEHPAYGQVALKRLHPEARDVRLPDGRLLRERFVEERDVLKELRYHLEERTPSLPADADTVPDCLDLVENEENLFMAITLARGRSVTDWLEDWPDGLGEARATAIVLRLASVLHILHRNLRRTYSDIQFGNLFWEAAVGRPDYSGHLMVIDWNVVSPRLPDDPGPVAHADDRQAYQQLVAQYDAGVRDDLFHSGAFLFRLLTGRATPAGGWPLAGLLALAQWRRLSRGMRHLLVDLLNIDPEQRRVTSAEALIGRLEALEERWRITLAQMERRLHDLGEERSAAGQDAGKLVAWALTTDAWLPAFRQPRLALDEESTRRVGELENQVREYLGDDLVSDMVRGRLFFDGGNYNEAQKIFSALERAGQGLPALRWRLLTELAWQELNAGSQRSEPFARDLRNLRAAIAQLETHKWTSELLDENRQSMLAAYPMYRYWAGEARLRHALSEDETGLLAAADAEQELACLPDPLNAGSGEAYRRALRAETGSLAEKAAAWKVNDRYQQLRRKDRQALDNRWKEWQKSYQTSDFQALLSLLQRCLERAPGDREWLALAYDWASKPLQLGEQDHWPEADELLTLAVGYSYPQGQRKVGKKEDDQPADAIAWGLDEAFPARMAAGEALLATIGQAWRQVRWLRRWLAQLKEGRWTEVAQAVQQEATLFQAEPGRASLLEILWQWWQKSDYDPALWDAYRLMRPEVENDLYARWQEARECFSQGRFYEAQAVLSTLVVRTYEMELNELIQEWQKKVNGRIRMENEELNRLWDQAYRPWQEKMGAWLSNEPGQPPLLRELAEKAQSLLQKGRYDLACDTIQLGLRHCAETRLPILEGTGLTRQDWLVELDEACNWFKEVDEIKPEEADHCLAMAQRIDNLLPTVQKAASQKLENQINGILERQPLVDLFLVELDHNSLRLGERFVSKRLEAQKALLATLFIKQDQAQLQAWRRFRETLDQASDDNGETKPEERLADMAKANLLEEFLPKQPALWPVCQDYVTKRLLPYWPPAWPEIKEWLLAIQEHAKRIGSEQEAKAKQWVLNVGRLEVLAYAFKRFEERETSLEESNNYLVQVLSRAVPSEGMADVIRLSLRGWLPDWLRAVCERAPDLPLASLKALQEQLQPFSNENAAVAQEFAQLEQVVDWLQARDNINRALEEDSPQLISVDFKHFQAGRYQVLAASYLEEQFAVQYEQRAEPVAENIRELTTWPEHAGAWPKITHWKTIWQPTASPKSKLSTDLARVRQWLDRWQPVSGKLWVERWNKDAIERIRQANELAKLVCLLEEQGLNCPVEQFALIYEQLDPTHQNWARESLGAKLKSEIDLPEREIITFAEGAWEILKREDLKAAERAPLISRLWDDAAGNYRLWLRKESLLSSYLPNLASALRTSVDVHKKKEECERRDLGQAFAERLAALAAEGSDLDSGVFVERLWGLRREFDVLQKLFVGWPDNRGLEEIRERFRDIVMTFPRPADDIERSEGIDDDEFTEGA